MSTSATPASTPGTTPVQGPTGLRKAAAQGGTDLFASLLALVGDTRQGEALAADPLQADSTLPDPQADDGEADNPLSNLLNWAYPSGLGDLSALAGAAGQVGADTSVALATSPRALTPTLAQATGLVTGLTDPPRATPGIDLSGLGLAAVTPQESLETPLPAWLAQGRPATPIAGHPSAAPLTQPAIDASLPAPGATAAAQPLPTPATPAASLTPTAANPASPATTAVSGTQGTPAGDKTRKSGPSLTATLQARDVAAGDAARGLPHALAAAGRSTITLDSRLAGTGWRASPPDATAPAPALTPATAATTEWRRAPGEAAAPRDLLAPVSAEPGALAGRPTEAAALSDGQATTDGMPGTPEAETPGHLGAHQLRHASLRVGEGSAEAIEVQLEISGQEVRVDFRTDSAETRQGLQQSATPALGELLERSGMQLGGVSVGGQGLAGGDGRGSGGDAQRRHTGQDGRTGAATEAAPAAPVRPRTDGSRPLDVFA